MNMCEKCFPGSRLHMAEHARFKYYKQAKATLIIIGLILEYNFAFIYVGKV